MSKEEQEVNYRDEVLRLVAEGKLRHTTKYVGIAYDEVRRKSLRQNRRKFIKII